MKITIITLFPEMIASFTKDSIIKRAQEKGAVTIEYINLRDFALDSYGTVDERPYGGGAGMVMRVEPLHEALKKTGAGHVVLTSAKGKTYNQKKAQDFAKLEHLIIIAAHYEGVDERIMNEIDEEVSVGEFVLTGGEIPAALIIDSVVRLLPGVLKKEEATQEESFFEISVVELSKLFPGNEVLEKLQKNNHKTVTLLEYPHYTRPEKWNDQEVPEILMSGNHEKIRIWRLKEAFKQTLAKRPDLLVA
jgi:tRNA (guanine37-N1)-methyltransferase